LLLLLLVGASSRCLLLLLLLLGWWINLHWFCSSWGSQWRACCVSCPDGGLRCGAAPAVDQLGPVPEANCTSSIRKLLQQLQPRLLAAWLTPLCCC
jgi:hypothetical protein